MVKSRLCGDFITAFQYLKDTYRDDGEGHFVRNCRDGTRSNGVKLKEGKFRLDIGKKFAFNLYFKGSENLSRLPREVVAAPALALFKTSEDKALSNLV